MPAIPLLSRGLFSSASSSTSSSRGFSSYTGSSGSSSGYRGSSSGSSTGLLPGSTVPITSSTTDSGDSGSGDSKVAIYTVIGFFAVVGFCIVAFAVHRCTHPCRRARRAQRTTEKDTPARQATEKFRTDRDYLRRRERERQAVEAALIIQMSLPVPEPTRYNMGHRSVRPTETSTMGSSAEVRLARPEPALHRPSSTNAPATGSRPSTPLPKYERHDPLRRVEETAELDPRGQSPSSTERDNPSPNVEGGSD